MKNKNVDFLVVPTPEEENASEILKDEHGTDTTTSFMYAVIKRVLGDDIDVVERFLGKKPRKGS